MHPMLNIAVRAARKAGDFIIRSSENLDNIESNLKSSDDYVTNIDQIAEKLIIEVLTDAYPNHCILCEEGGLTTKSDKDYQWVIDPLDGTRNFMHGFPHFSISIALVIRGRTELGCVYDPVRNELFTAERGRGAQLNNSRLRVNQPVELKGTILATGFPFKQRQFSQPFFAILEDLFIECADFRRTGSAALDLCYVAAGRVDGYFEIGLKPWDFMAGELIAKEAGAICIDFSGGTNQGKSGNFIVGHSKLVSAITSKIRKHAPIELLR